MTEAQLKALLDHVKSGEVGIADALSALKDLPFTEMASSHTIIDNHRAIRVGYPEVIYGAGKTTEQVIEILGHLFKKECNILATRVPKEMADAVLENYPQMHYNKIGRTLSFAPKAIENVGGKIAIVAAGTSDLPVVEEAYETARLFGNDVIKIVDVGVAGIHRLFARLDEIRSARVVIVVAGMEGALASVIGGLIDKPMIAVPTSVGYGANFGGLSALLTMLNSCSSGATVVNIDNGFGAAYAASQINRL